MKKFMLLAFMILLPATLIIIILAVPLLQEKIIWTQTGRSPVAVAFHQKFIETGEMQKPKNADIDLSDIDDVFRYVFSALDSEVMVYPSENYYYFRIRVNKKDIWGNIRLSPPDLDKGILRFAYFEFNEVKEGNEFKKGLSWKKQYGPAEGLRIKEISEMRYNATHRGRNVIFNLHPINQSPPKLFMLIGNEIFVERTYDDSGHQFFLIFNKLNQNFMFVLNEENQLPENLIKLNQENLLIGEKSGFVFYNDGNRKILVGVSLKNSLENNYYDGPFDQLADNYADQTEIAKYIQIAYPQTKDRIDKYGRFVDNATNRVAVAPYHVYSFQGELIDVVKKCATSLWFYECITHDHQKNIQP